MNIAGMLLRIERLKQGKGQKEICQGICVVSYLSKIERGKVDPDPEILRRLFQELGIEYCCDRDFLAWAEDLMKKAYYQLDYSLDRAAFRELTPEDEKLSYSPFALDWIILKGLERDEIPIEVLDECADAMDPQQLAWYYMVPDVCRGQENIRRAKRAYEILGSSTSLLHLALAYWEASEYLKVQELCEQAADLAVREGNTYNIADSFFMAGNLYACLKLDELMFSNYERGIRLLQNTFWAEELDGVYYNMGATFLEMNRFDEARKYLDMVQGKHFLLDQKKCLLEIRTGNHEKAMQYLEEMEKEAAKLPPDHEIQLLMLEEARMELKKDFLSDRAYLNLLDRLMQLLEQELHFGYMNFYHDQYKEACCRQRMYRKAMEIETKFSSITSKMLFKR